MLVYKLIYVFMLNNAMGNHRLHYGVVVIYDSSYMSQHDMSFLYLLSELNLNNLHINTSRRILIGFSSLLIYECLPK